MAARCTDYFSARQIGLKSAAKHSQLLTAPNVVAEFLQ
jgi:hypothetical protein